MNWQSKLLHWYRRHKRDLPWRRTRDPYRIWVSEIMLQQTTVEAVIPYYERFLTRFPTMRDLAAADEEEVLGLWSGLGYYSRARNLHKAARMIEKLPDTVEGLMQLPGIGRYTAGAVASIAFGQRAPILDGNVIRVLSRLYAIGVDPKSTLGQKTFWRKAKDILPHQSVGDFNQALMELGAMVCSPENPACHLCPLVSICAARRKGCPESFPAGAKRTEYRDIKMSAAVVLRGRKVLMVRRPEAGLLRGMWELPMAEGGDRDLRRKWPVEIVRPLPSVRHSVLNRRLLIAPYLCRDRGIRGVGVPLRWVDISPLLNRQSRIAQLKWGGESRFSTPIPPHRGSVSAKCVETTDQESSSHLPLATSSMNRKVLRECLDISMELRTALFHADHIRS